METWKLQREAACAFRVVTSCIQGSDDAIKALRNPETYKADDLQEWEIRSPQRMLADH